jgi:FtsH-binding integral membrane protein
MNNALPLPLGNPANNPVLETPSGVSHSDQVKRVLRNTYALLAMTLLFSAGVAFCSSVWSSR